MPGVARDEHLQAQLLDWVQLLQTLSLKYIVLADTAPS